MPPGESWTSWTPAEMGSGWRSVFQTRVPDKAGCRELRHPVGPHPLGPVAASTFVKGHRTEAAHARPVKARRAPNAHCPSDLRRPWEGFLPKSASASRAHTPAASDGPASWRAPGRTTPRVVLKSQSPCGHEGSGCRWEGGRRPGAGARKAQKERAIREAAVRGAPTGASGSAPARRSAGAHGVFFISES